MCEVLQGSDSRDAKKEIKMNLPKEFIGRVIRTWGPKGEQWLSALDGTLTELKKRWELSDITLMPELSYNLVAKVTSKIYGPVGPNLMVRKIGKSGFRLPCC